MTPLIKHFAYMLLCLTAGFSSRAQISDSLYMLIPDKFKPVDKKHVTPAEKRNILKYTGLFSYNKRALQEADNMAEAFERENKYAGRDTRIKNFGALAGYYTAYNDYKTLNACADSSIALIGSDTAYRKALADAYANKAQALAQLRFMEEASILCRKAETLCMELKDSLGIGNAHNLQIDIFRDLHLFEQSVIEAREGYTYLYPSLRSKNLKNYIYCNFHIETAKCYLEWYAVEQNHSFLDSIDVHIAKVKNMPDKDAEQWFSICYTLKGIKAYYNSQYNTSIAYMDSSLMPRFADKDMFYSLNPLKQIYKGVCMMLLGKKEGRELILDNMDQTGNVYLEILAKNELYNNAYERKDWQEALMWYTLLKKDQDSVNTLGHRGKVFEVMQKYRVKEKEAKITELQLAGIAEKTEKQTFYLITVTLVLVLIIIVISLFSLTRKRKIKNLLIQKAFEDEQQKLQELIVSQDKKLQAEKNKAISVLQKKISRDMHDGLVSAMATLKFYVGGKHMEEKNHTNKLVLADIESEISSVYIQMRDYMQNLNKGFDNIIYDLGNFLISLSEQFSNPEVFLITLDVDIDLLKEKLSPEKQNQIKMIVKEAVANAMKHSSAKTLNISFYFEGNSCYFNITDNGKGFSVALAEKGLGLESIRSRIQQLDGVLDIDSFTGGTTLRGSFPLVT